MSLAYKFPVMYELMVGICHGKALNKRYALIAEEIGDNKRVFELGCGTAMVYPFLHQGCAYEGWDLNDRFLAFAKKRGARNVLKRNVFDFNNYPDNDVILICDVLHHLVPLHTKLVQEALQRTKRLIVSEPARSSKAWKMLKPLALAYHYMFGDYDGINDLGQILEWGYNKEKLQSFFSSLGCTKTVTVGWDMIAVFDVQRAPARGTDD